MATGWTVGTSGGNKLVTQPTIGTSGGNKNATEVWVGTSGGNKLVFPGFSMAAGTQTDTSVFPAGAQSYLDVYSTGTYAVSLANTGGGASGNWITPTSLAPGSYEIRATINTGTLTGGSATGTWLALTTSRSWYVDRATIGTKACGLTIEIRLGSVTVYSETVTLRATVSP